MLTFIFGLLVYLFLSIWTALLITYCYPKFDFKKVLMKHILFSPCIASILYLKETS